MLRLKYKGNKTVNIKFNGEEFSLFQGFAFYTQNKFVERIANLNELIENQEIEKIVDDSIELPSIVGPYYVKEPFITNEVLSVFGIIVNYGIADNYGVAINPKRVGPAYPVRYADLLDKPKINGRALMPGNNELADFRIVQVETSSTGGIKEAGQGLTDFNFTHDYKAKLDFLHTDVFSDLARQKVNREFFNSNGLYQKGIAITPRDTNEDTEIKEDNIQILSTVHSVDDLSEKNISEINIVGDPETVSIKATGVPEEITFTISAQPILNKIPTSQSPLTGGRRVIMRGIDLDFDTHPDQLWLKCEMLDMETGEIIEDMISLDNKRDAFRAWLGV